MKIKVRSFILVSLFIVFILSIFIVFAILRNNSVSFSANILLIIILLSGVVLFINSQQLITQIKNQTEDSELNKTDSENINEKIIETVIEKSPEIEIDIKKVLPKEKLKPELFSEELLRNLSGEIPIIQALLYIKNPTDDMFKCTGKFAFFSEKDPVDFKSGETLPGQAVKNKSIVTISNIPENYMIVASGLGKGTPGYLTYVPIISHDEVIGLIEFATFSPVSGSLIKSLAQFSEKIADSISKFIKK
jgi:hypothetical protein